MISVGIDVSKGSSTVCLLRPCGEVVLSPFEVAHTQEKLSELVNIIRGYDEETKIVMEATGHYHLPILFVLQEQGFFVSVVNPMLMKKYASVSIRKVKTDKMDALKIAKFGLDYWMDLRAYSFDEDVYRELKFLSRQYFQLMSIRIKYKVMLSSLYDEIMPGISSILNTHSRDFTKDKVVDFVMHFKHYNNITKLSESTFVTRYEKWAKKEGYHFNADKAKQLYNHAKNSITTLRAQMDSTQMITKQLSQGIKTVSDSLKQILSRMQVLAKSLPEYDVIRAMPGIGDNLAPRLIAEIGDIRRFHSAKALIAYAGIDTPPHQSGQFTAANRKISKRGSRYLRQVGFEMILCLKCTSPKADTAVYDFIKKKEAQGKAKKQAMIAGLNKFLRIYYARVNELIS